jgi:hypothetical protein
MGNYLKQPRGKKLSKSDEIHRVDADASAKVSRGTQAEVGDVLETPNGEEFDVVDEKEADHE